MIHVDVSDEFTAAGRTLVTDPWKNPAAARERLTLATCGCWKDPELAARGLYCPSCSRELGVTQ